MSCWADRMSATTLSLDLPADYRISDLSAFHRRDPQQIGERWTEHGAAGITLDKAFCLNGQHVRLSLQFVPGQVHATVDDIAPFQTVDRLTTLISRLLGLDQPVAEFAARFAAHPVLGPLLRERPGLRVPQTATPFEALTWAITGQQISVAAAVALRRKLILAAALPVGDLWAYPDADAVLGMREAGLRAAGFSGSKTRCLLAVAEAVQSGALPLEDWRDTRPVEAMREMLLAVPGIGPWTVNYTLLRGYGWLDGALHGDAAVRRALQALLGSDGPLSAATVERWLADCRPFRALVAAHLWASGGVLAA